MHPAPFQYRQYSGSQPSAGPGSSTIKMHEVGGILTLPWERIQRMGRLTKEVRTPSVITARSDLQYSMLERHSMITIWAGSKMAETHRWIILAMIVYVATKELKSTIFLA